MKLSMNLGSYSTRIASKCQFVNNFIKCWQFKNFKAKCLKQINLWNFLLKIKHKSIDTTNLKTLFLQIMVQVFLISVLS